MNHAVTSGSPFSLFLLRLSTKEISMFHTLKTLKINTLCFFFFRFVWSFVQWENSSGLSHGGCRAPLPSAAVGRLRSPSLWFTCAEEHPPQGFVHTTLLVLRHHPRHARWDIDALTFCHALKRLCGTKQQQSCDHALLSVCRYDGSGTVPAALQRPEAALREWNGEQRGGRALALHQRIHAALCLLLPAARRHVNLHQPGPAQAGATAHHHICFRQVRWTVTPLSNVNIQTSEFLWSSTVNKV